MLTAEVGTQRRIAMSALTSASVHSRHAVGPQQLTLCAIRVVVAAQNSGELLKGHVTADLFGPDVQPCNADTPSHAMSEWHSAMTTVIT